MTSMGQPIVKQADRFIGTEIDDEVVLMDLEQGSFFSVTGTALDIWNALDGTRDRDAVVATMSELFGASAAEIAHDVDSFLGELSAAGLVSGYTPGG